MSALRHQERDHAIKADRGQQRRQNAEETRERRHQPFGEERFLDATGLWTREALLRRLAQEYQYDAYSLVRWEQVAIDRVRIPFDARVEQSVEVAFFQVLGPFSPGCVFPMPDLLAA